MTADPNTLQCYCNTKWEPYRDTEMGGVDITSNQEEGILLQRYCDRGEKCLAILLKLWGQGSKRLLGGQILYTPTPHP